MTPPFDAAIARKMLDDLRAELRAANEKRNQLEVQLAGCSAAALGWDKEPAQTGDYSWSPAYQDVLGLRRKYEAKLKQAA